MDDAGPHPPPTGPDGPPGPQAGHEPTGAASTTRRRLSRRSLLVVGGGGVVVLGLGAAALTLHRRSSPDLGPERDLTSLVHRLTEQLHPDMPYRPPDDRERDVAVEALTAVAEHPDDGPARDELERLGFTVCTAADGDNRYIVAVSDPTTERSWGLYAFPIDHPIRTLVEVPHPRADLQTEDVGLDLVAELPDAAYIEAGAHRRASDGQADVAHESGSLFHAVVTRLASTRRIPQVQLHGFDDADEPEVDVILSPGSSRAGSDIENAARRLDEAELSLCRAWVEDCGDLGGRTNVQGIAAREIGTAFLHVELSDAVRSEGSDRQVVAKALSAVFL